MISFIVVVIYLPSNWRITNEENVTLGRAEILQVLFSFSCTKRFWEEMKVNIFSRWFMFTSFVQISRWSHTGWMKESSFPLPKLLINRNEHFGRGIAGRWLSLLRRSSNCVCSGKKAIHKILYISREREEHQNVEKRGWKIPANNKQMMASKEN